MLNNMPYLPCKMLYSILNRIKSSNGKFSEALERWKPSFVQLMAIRIYKAIYVITMGLVVVMDMHTPPPPSEYRRYNFLAQDFGPRSIYRFLVCRPKMEEKQIF